MDNERDLIGILSLVRTHVEIRNRSWMTRVHKNCFIGSDAVDFLVTQGFADSREQAVSIGNKMMSKKMIKHVTDGHKFKDAYLYYRFMEDDNEDSMALGATNAGNGKTTHQGQGGCKWSFCPHTAHNSYLLDIGLAEELERAVAGGSSEARLSAINKLRGRVREQAEPDAPDWILSQSTIVNRIAVNVYQRKRPRGDFKNVKITGVVNESPKAFIAGMMSFDINSPRKKWESMFEDGVVVEVIETGEPVTNPTVLASSPTNHGGVASLRISSEDIETITPALPQEYGKSQDDIFGFLKTVDLAGVPRGMPIAFLNDSERQHALAHLRKQMMLSKPQECMLCQASFASSKNIRFCPCCAMVSCVSCVSKRVFEVVSRQCVSVCIHCYRESSRIRHPPEAVKDSSNIDANVRGKWWRPEEIGMVDYGSSYVESSSLMSNMESPLSAEKYEYNQANPSTSRSSPASPTAYNSNVKPLVPGLLDADTEAETETATETEINLKTCRCKNCGEVVSRDIDAIEQHMSECRLTNINNGANVPSSAAHRMVSTVGESDGRIAPTNSKYCAGIARKPELENHPTKIIYRTARATSTSLMTVSHRPREVCAFQDTFTDADGTSYLYEISVRHCEVHGQSNHVTVDVLSLLYVARPIKGNKNACQITIISQIDSRIGNTGWLLSYLTEEGSDSIGGPRTKDMLGILQDLQDSGELVNLLQGNDDEKVTLDHFQLLAVLGRGGFGKVMQVRHIPTDKIYAMKILKKSELRRRRQIERTQTERTILAAVKHPFIVCLHYAFQNSQKLYMVMDFVQGGDFFTVMRKFRRLPEDWVRVYVAEIAMALQHLHDIQIVYRDLKPENILLCGDGHIKLTDFGLSRYFETRPPAPEDMVEDSGDTSDMITRSFCGTEQYMSPEMLLQQGHNYRMDWWCLGLLMHEMISAKHPFHGASHYDTLRNMVTKQPNIDSRLTKEAVLVVRSFLIKVPRARLCCTTGINELKDLAFFNGLDWVALQEKRIEMPYKPALKDSVDITSFETVFTREAPVDSVSDANSNEKSKGGKGILGTIFGIGKTDTNAVAAPDQDAFKDFAFAKDEDLDGIVKSD